MRKNFEFFNDNSKIKPFFVIKAVLCLRFAATSLPEYVSGWCGHEFEFHSQSFLLTYPEVDLSL